MNKARVAIFFGVVCLAVGLGLLWSRRAERLVAPQEKAAPLSGLAWSGVVPGQATREDTESALGPPVRVREDAGTTVLEYPSSNMYWTNEVSLREGKVSVVIERLFPPKNTSFASLSKATTEEPVVLYGNDTESNIFLYVFGSSGFALLANREGDTVFEAWYFAPANIESLLSLPEFSAYSTSPRKRRDI